MKKNLFIMIIIMGLVSCSGERGPIGPQGPQGIEGKSYIGKSIEIKVNFNNQNEFVYTFIDDNIEVLESDIVLVYHSEEFINDPTGPINVWKPMPHIIYFNNGLELMYNYDYTFHNVRMYMDGNIDFNSLAPQYYQNQLFKIVILPVNYANDYNVDTSSYIKLMNSLEENNLMLNNFSLGIEQ